MKQYIFIVNLFRDINVNAIFIILLVRFKTDWRTLQKRDMHAASF
jgi:hypothetical protein